MKKLSRGEKDIIAITGMFVLLQEEGLTTKKKKEGESICLAHKQIQRLLTSALSLDQMQTVP